MVTVTKEMYSSLLSLPTFHNIEINFEESESSGKYSISFFLVFLLLLCVGFPSLGDTDSHPVMEDFESKLVCPKCKSTRFSKTPEGRLVCEDGHVLEVFPFL
jgi:hypothetical protein